MNKNRLFPLSFLLSFLFFFSFGKNYSKVAAQDPFVVVLDAGHGGHDPGNLGNGYLEKNIALNIVLRVGRILEQNPDIKVVYTRKDDSFVDLFVRGEIANKANADLFVSIHCDSHSSDAHGAGTFVLGLHANEQNFEIAKKENSVIYLEDNYATRYADYDINSPESVIGLTIMQEEFLDQSIALAKAIQDGFSKKLKRKDRKVKQAGFIVLHQTFMPSVLVETGFLTNDNEGAYLNSPSGQTEMGMAIADAIQYYKMNALSDVAQGAIGTMPSAPDPESAVTETAQDLPKVVNEPSGSDKDDVTAMLEQAEKIAVESITKREEVVNESPVDVKEEVASNVEEVAEKSNPAEEVTEIKEEPSSVEEKQSEQPTELVVTEVNEAGRPKIVKEELKAIETSSTEPAPSTENTEKVVEVAKEAEPTPITVEAEAKPAPNIEFRVQLMASGKNLSADHSIFKGLSPISKEPYKNLFRYMHGSTGKYFEAQLMKKVADAKGFTTSFLVAYKDGVRIDVKEARKYVLE